MQYPWKNKYKFISAVVYWLTDKSGNINEAVNIQRSLRISRGLIFMLTSAFYLAGPPFSPVMIKLGVVLAVFLATILAQNLFDNWNIMGLYKITPSAEDFPVRRPNEQYMPVLKLIVLETTGALMLMLPTGGLDSPFVWYAFNPIVTATVFLPALYCWGTLLLFLGAAIGISMVYPGFSGSLMLFLYIHMSTLLVFLLATSLYQLATSLHKRLGQAYAELARAHAATEKSLEHTSALYQALEAFSTREDRIQLVNVLAIYANKLCEAPAACFLPAGLDEGGPAGSRTLLCSADQTGCHEGMDWEAEMNRLWNKLKADQGPIEQFLEQETGQLTAAPIVSNGECFGLLACWQSAEGSQQEKKRALAFLARIAGIILERLKTDNLWERLLVSEEQNRIANEIHDGVSQYLFSLVCALGAIAHEQGNLQDESIQGKLALLQDTALRASRELRVSIYHLSPHQRGESIFVDTLASYLDDLGRLHNIQVDLQCEGNEEVLSPALRKGLYRIVREASNNAVRHGRCSLLKVHLRMFPKQTILEIADNGCGCQEPNKGAFAGQTGLGKRNMRQLAAYFDGGLEIESEPGRGTVVRCTIPKNSGQPYDRKEATY